MKLSWKEKFESGYVRDRIIRSTESCIKTVSSRREKYKNWHSDDTKNKIAESLSKNIVQLTLAGEFVKEWQSSQEVEKSTDIFGTSVRRCCRGKNKSAGGYRWIYASEYHELV